jgi:hypothetical protein
VENTLVRLTQKIYELEQTVDEPSMSLSWSNGQTYRHETTVEEKRHALDIMRADRDWLRSRVEILPAQGSGDPPAELSDLVARFGSEFIDEARAAQGSNRLFLCEDYALRLLAMAAFRITGTWLQPVLMLARDDGHLSFDQYRGTLVSMIQTRLDFITVDSGVIASALPPTTSLQLPRDFLTLAARIGGAKAELSSHIQAALGAIAQFWNDGSLPWTLRQAAVGTLLENLCRDRTLDHVRVIIRSFALFNRRILNDAFFDDYLIGWVRGHFIPL